MPCEVEPSEVSAVVPLKQPLHSPFLADGCESSYGFVSGNGFWLYLINGTAINIYCAESGKWLGGHCFGKSLNNPSAKITAATEFISSHLASPCLLLAINQDEESLVCMLNVDLCQVIQAVLIPDRVTCLDVVSSIGGACIQTHNMNRRLRYMFGIVAVGTLHGHLFFLDLCLDEKFNCDEELPNITAVVKKQDFTAERREAAISRKQHIFLHLNVESTSGSSFEFKSGNNAVGSFPNGEVYVSTAKYIKSLTALAIGFNFGGIQLWDLHDLCLQFTISNDQYEQSIVTFAFQEPENDPRNFCYLWVVKGHSIMDDDQPDTVSVASLFALTYFKRDYIDGFGTLYTELQTCNKRFEMPLANNRVHSTLEGSRLISCTVVNQRDESHYVSSGSLNESDSGSEDISVCFLSWQVWRADTGHSRPSCYLAVFDLNQWYQAHMPLSVRSGANDLNPYLGVFDLDKAANRFEYKDILGLHTIPKSVKRFKSLLVSEEFFYPSSLSFKFLCFAESGLCSIAYFGLQKQLLFGIAEYGPKAVLNPKEIFSALIKSGLVPDTQGGPERTPLVLQREAILQLALEYHLPSFFMKCLKEWRYSESMHECCTSKALLSWAWKKVINIKLSIDKLSLPLFNCNGVDIDKASLRQLSNFKRQLTLIDSIMSGYQKFVTPRTEQGLEELQCRKDAISSIHSYLHVMLWLRSVYVLPEVCEEACSIVAYRSNYLNDLYCNRRANLKKLHKSLSANDVLLIDGMVKESGIGNSWMEKNGSGFYPPPSIYAALSCYLLDGVSLESRHALVYYLLLDLRDTNGDANFRAELKKFPGNFGFSKSMGKLVKAFLYLDRKECGHAIKKLLHPAVKKSDILPWQHQRIIKSFLYCRAPQIALKYIVRMHPFQNTVEEMKTMMSVLLAYGASTQAYEYQNKRQQNVYGCELLNHLYLGCQEMNKMKELMYLPLNSFESSTLVKFLSESEDPHAHEHLVVYHLLHCNFFEAVKVNEKLSRMLMNKVTTHHDAMIYERTVDREALVESLMVAISKPERGLVEEMKRSPLVINKKEEMPLSLSVSVNNRTVKKSTYADILQSLINKGLSGEMPENSSARTKIRSTCYEDLPLLCPPITPESIRRPSHNRSGNSSIAKRSLLQTSPSEFDSPAKRSRLLDSAPFQPSPLTKRKTPRSLAGDMMSLLQTPPIHRRLSNSISGVVSTTPVIRPQSILKKTETKKLSFHTAPTPPLLSEDDSSDEVMQTDDNISEGKDATEDGNSTRQIRFDLPKSPSIEKSPQQASIVIEASSFSSDLEEEVATPKASCNEQGVSFLNLTREPLESYRKKTSFSTSTTQSDQMEVEISKEHASSLSALKMPMESFASAPQVTVRKSIHFFESSPDIEVISPAPSKDQSFSHQKSKLYSNSPLRSGLDCTSLLIDQQITLVSDSQLSLQSLQETPAKSKDKIPVALTTDPSVETSSDHSDDDMFYSPCNDLETGINRASSAFAEPKTLFKEINFMHKDGTPIKDPIVQDLCESDKSNKTLTFSFTDSSKSSTVDHKDANSSHASDKALFSSSEPSNQTEETTPELETSASADDIVMPHQNISTISENTLVSQQNLPFTFSEPLTQDMGSVVNTEAANSTAEQDGKLNFTFSEPANLSIEEPNKFPSVGGYTPMNFWPPDTPVATRPSRAFFFSKSTTPNEKVLSSAQNVALPKSSVLLPEKEVSFPTAESLLDISKIPPKHRFTFSKTTPGQSTYISQPKEKNQSDSFSSLAKSFLDSSAMPPPKTRYTSTETIHERSTVLQPNEKSLSESIFSTKLMNYEDNESMTPQKSRRTFVFSKPSPISEVSLFAKDPSTNKMESSAKNVKIRSSVSKVQDKNMEFQSATKEANLSGMSFMDVSKNPRKSRFTFSKPIPEEKTESSDTLVKKDISVILRNQPTEKADIPAFTFSLPIPHAESSTAKKGLVKTTGNESKNESEFLKSSAKTYEEFSNLLQTSSNDGAHQRDIKKSLLSSPSTSLPEESHSESKSQSSSVSEAGIKSTTKKIVKIGKKDATTPTLTGKKKGRILEALAKTPEHPLPSFMFSPPLTRGRLRQKKVDETMGSSFCSVASETSFTKPMSSPPMDSILEGIIQEKKLEPKKRTSKTKTSSQGRMSSQKRASIRKSRNQSRLAASEKSLLLSTTLNESQTGPSTSNLSPSMDSSVRHSMVLRHTKAKPKPDNIF